MPREFGLIHAISTESILLDFTEEKETKTKACNYCVSAFQAQSENIVFNTLFLMVHKDNV